MAVPPTQLGPYCSREPGERSRAVLGRGPPAFGLPSPHICMKRGSQDWLPIGEAGPQAECSLKRTPGFWGLGPAHSWRFQGRVRPDPQSNTGTFEGGRAWQLRIRLHILAVTLISCVVRSERMHEKCARQQGSVHPGHLTPSFQVVPGLTASGSMRPPSAAVPGLLLPMGVAQDPRTQ